MNLKKLLLFIILFLTIGSSRENPKHSSFSWDPFLDTLQARTIRWFLEVTPPTGLTPDRWPTKSPSSIAAVGFALTCYPIAVERKVMTRAEAADRVLTTLRTFWTLPQSDRPENVGGYKGFYYHFIDQQTGFREWTCELSTVDTGLLMMGVLFCQSYFDKESKEEAEIRSLADSLYRRVDWKWSMGDTTAVLMGWRPEKGFHHLTWHGFNEAQFLYVLALGSPTYPVPPAAYNHWFSTYTWGRLYGQEYLQFAPLFGYQYTACWLNLRGIHDSYSKSKNVDYFEFGRRATLAQRQYGKENPNKWNDYSESIWGWTACDGPRDTSFEVNGVRRRFRSYSARGFSTTWTFDDGTIAPTAPGGSLPFAPTECTEALKAMSEKYGTDLWTPYGFKDSFNPSYITPSTPNGWFGKDYLGIDQGPIALMVENLRNGFVWNVMKQNPYIVKGLKRAGFSGGWLEKSSSPK
ncbi:MAG: Tat pathway signal protein [Ignavibacteriales bacterium]|nr:Tat pathway signal protein [Ignavibacteriales bacterium]